MNEANIPQEYQDLIGELVNGNNLSFEDALQVVYPGAIIAEKPSSSQPSTSTEASSTSNNTSTSTPSNNTSSTINPTNPTENPTPEANFSTPSYNTNDQFTEEQKAAMLAEANGDRIKGGDSAGDPSNEPDLH